MARDYKVFLEDVLEAVSKIRRYTAGLSKEVFSGDEKTLDAVVRNLEVIGEAIKKVPPEVRSKYPSVDWQRIAGLRVLAIRPAATLHGTVFARTMLRFFVATYALWTLPTTVAL